MLQITTTFVTIGQGPQQESPQMNVGLESVKARHGQQGGMLSSGPAKGSASLGCHGELCCLELEQES